MKKKKIWEEGKKDEDDLSIYTEDTRENWLEDDEISPIEEAFMTGYESA